MSTGIIILIVVILLVIWVISIYNNLVKLRNNRENAFANIDVQLKQRYDLVPQLVSTVKGYCSTYGCHGCHQHQRQDCR